MARVVGIDGCRKGWVAVALDDDGVVTVHELSTIAALPLDVAVAGIDIPMRFPIAGRRAAEVAARVALGQRRSSIFFTPPRHVLDASTHAVACELSRAAGLGGISLQAFNLRPKIFEVEAWRAGATFHLEEVHPELSFAVLLGAPAVHSKKTPEGQAERRAALAAAGNEIDGPVNDDVLDAAVCAWTARRIAEATAVPFGDADDSIWA